MTRVWRTRSGIVGVLVVGLALMVGGRLAFSFWAARSRTAQVRGCATNLKVLGLALELYSTDVAGAFPRIPGADYPPNPVNALKMLEKAYVKAIPACPAAGSDTYTAGYSVGYDPDAYTVVCVGAWHVEAGPGVNFPQYTSTLGLVPELPCGPLGHAENHGPVRLPPGLGLDHVVPGMTVERVREVVNSPDLLEHLDQSYVVVPGHVLVEFDLQRRVNHLIFGKSLTLGATTLRIGDDATRLRALLGTPSLIEEPPVVSSFWTYDDPSSSLELKVEIREGRLYRLEMDSTVKKTPAPIPTGHGEG